MYWLIRRSAATGFSSLFYLVPAVTALFAYALFGEKLDALSLAGMLVCAVGVFVVSRGAPDTAAARQGNSRVTSRAGRAPSASASRSRRACRRRG